MYVRLAFAVAAHLEPEILIVDEVLAVGDAEFQKKCLGKMGSVAESGRTVLFVSHSVDAVRSLCRRGIWLKNGHLQADGPVERVIDEYYESVSDGTDFTASNSDYGLTITGVRLKNESGREVSQFNAGEDLTVEISYEASKHIESPLFAVGVNGRNGSCFTANMLLDGEQPRFIEGSGSLSCTFRAIPLLPQSYTVRIGVRSANNRDAIIPYGDAASFTVASELSDFGFKGEHLNHAKYATPVVIPYEWKLPDGGRIAIALDRRNLYEPERAS